jgi:hypothetical protein
MGKKVFMILVMVALAFSSLEVLAQVTLQYDNSIPVFYNDKKYTDPWGGGLNAAQYGRLDLNGDGTEDLVIYDRSSNLLNTYIKTESGFIFNPSYRIYLPEDIEGWILFKDFDCDGLKDIFTNSTAGMKVYRNIGSPDTEPVWDLFMDPVLTEGSSGTINLQVNITDVPGIEDIDGDGDLDVLVYNFAIGGFIRYHQNMSVERSGSCGLLDFEFVSRNWGYFEECDCHVYAFQEFGEYCEDLVPARVMHPGGKSLLLIDMDNDGDKDFLGGHEQCDEFYYLENKGTAAEARMTEFSEEFPDAENPANFPTFPAGFFDDFDDDGVDDLIVSPNTEYNPDKTIDYGHSSWFYKNNGSNELPQFDFITNTFLQSDMIDLGENAYPVLVDTDGDGDLDLLVGSNGFKVGDVFCGYISMFENTGSFSDPTYTLKDTDFLNLSEIAQFDMMPLISDLNHDGSPDLVIVSTKSDKKTVETRWYKNTAEIGNGLNINMDYDLLEIELKLNDTPFFTDVNEDGLTDLLIGKSTGRLEYHENKGNDVDPYFVLDNPAFLDIDDSFIEFKIYLVPFVIDIDLDGNDDLLTTDYSGHLTVYLDYKNDPDKTYKVIYNELTNSNESSVLGHHTWMTGGLISGTENPVIIFGNPQGGISVYKNIADNKQEESNKVVLKVYPNPLINSNTLITRSNISGNLLIFNNVGQLIDGPLEIRANRNLNLEIGYMPQGLYIFKVIDNVGRSDVQRFIRY